MSKLELLKQQLDNVKCQVELLTEMLYEYERPINNLLSDKKPLHDMSISERMQIANLLIKFYEDLKSCQ